MNKHALSLVAGLATLLPTAVSAQSFNVENNPAGAVAGSLFAGGIFMFMMLMLALGLAFFVFWVIMLIDCAKREWADKNLWLIILIVSFFAGFYWLAALLYYFIIKRKNVGTIPTAPAAPTQQPPAAPPAA